MTDKLRLILNLNSLSSESIDEFVSNFGEIIQGLVKNNQGTEEQYKNVLLDVLIELYFRVRSSISFEQYDAETLVYTLAYLAFKKQQKGRDRKAIILDQNYYEKGTVKLLSNELSKNLDKCEEIIKEMGEPGRTILRLSFYENMEDDEIKEHVHFESLEQLNKRRVKLVDRCIEST